MTLLDSLYTVGFLLYHWPSPLKVYNLAQHPWLLWGHFTCSQKIYILPELYDIFLKVAPYFESCMIYLTKFNNILKVAWYFESWINIILACHTEQATLAIQIGLRWKRYWEDSTLWHAKVIFIQLSKYQATFKISFNFVKNIAQLSKYGTTFRNISHSSGRVYIFWEHV